jgi:hypothetical protein
MFPTEARHHRNPRFWMAPVAMVAIALMIALFGLNSRADASTVYNRFQRSCNFGSCSPFVQTNPPYNSSFGSDCVTKSYTGQGGEYHLPPGVRC